METRHASTDEAPPQDAPAESTTGNGEAFDVLLRRVARGSVPTSPAPHTFSPATSLASGRLTILRKLGEGGMGIVHEAFDVQRGGRVALKTLHSVDPSAIYRLKNEFRALADVAHDNLIRLHELWNDEGTWFFTMDLVAGERFDRWVRPNDVLDEARLRIALPQLASAIAAIHAAGKLHRDLKPSNVLVTSDGHLVVLDFGLAVDPAPGGVGQTLAEQGVSGTPSYMAPEQAAAAQATAASDYYALGAMLFEALTGKLPFEGHAHDVLADKQRFDAPCPTTLCGGVASDLHALCAQLLARDPAARPDAVAVHGIVGAGDEPRCIEETRSPSITLPPATVLHGRDAELSALRAAFAASCVGDRPVVVLLSGESGIGKSALCDRFLSALRAEGHAVVLSGRCFERESVPFKAFDMVVDDLSRHLRKLPDVEAAALVPRDAHALRRLFPVLGRIATLADAPARGAVDPHELRRRAFLALSELFGRLRDRRPLVLHIDDLQWSDTDSTQLLMHLLRQPDAPRLLLLASHRSERMSGHPHLQPLYDALPVDVRLDVRAMHLRPLPDQAARALLSIELGHVSNALVQEGGGNPLLLGELARHVRALPTGTTGQVSLEHVIITRVAALAEPEQSLLRVLAVAARPLALRIANDAAGVSVDTRVVFETLRAARLVVSTGDGSGVECFHDKVREAVCLSLAADTLRQVHAALANVLTAEPSPDRAQLAAHLLGAGEPARAVVELVRAAELAFDELGFDRAARLYGEALALGGFDPEATQRFRVARAQALAEAGRARLAAEAYLDAMQHAAGETAHQLEHRAAVQHIYGGSLEEGRRLLARTLARRGVRLPLGMRGTFAALLVERTRLRLRGLDYRERVPDQPKAELLALLETSTLALLRLDFLGAAVLDARRLRLALDAGDTAAVAFGLTREMWNRHLGLGDPHDVPKIEKRLGALLARTDAPAARRWLLFTRGLYRYTGPEPDLPAALTDYDRLIALIDEQHYPNAAYDRSMAQMQRVNVLVWLGRFAEVARELPALLDATWERGDIAVHAMLAGGQSLGALIAVGALADAERVHARAAAAWSSCRNAYAFQDLFLLLGAVSLKLARGDARAALDRSKQDLERFASSPLRSSNAVAGQIQTAAAASALALAASSQGRERAELLRLVDKLLGKRLDPFVLLQSAALTNLQRGRDQAVEALRAALRDPRIAATPTFAQAASRQLGRILGGDEGQGLVRQADAFFHTGGVVEPERFVSSILPGFGT